MLDTAYMYGLGHNEQIIGDVLREGDNRKKVRLVLPPSSFDALLTLSRLVQVFLISKFGIEMNDKGELETDGALELRLPRPRPAPHPLYPRRLTRERHPLDRPLHQEPRRPVPGRLPSAPCRPQDVRPIFHLPLEFC